MVIKETHTSAIQPLLLYKIPIQSILCVFWGGQDGMVLKGQLPPVHYAGKLNFSTAAPELFD